MKNVAIFSESNHFSSGRKFAEGIKEVLEETDICYSCVQSVDTLNLNSAFELQNTEETYDAIITDCIERAELLKSVWKFTCKDSLPVLYSLDNKQIQIDDTINRYELNYKLCGKQIAEYILKIQKRGEASQKILKMENDGFLKTEILVKVKERTKLNFLSLASPTMRALRYLLPDFERQTGITVNLVEAAYDELQKAVSKMDSRDNNPYDLIRIDMVWLSQYAEKIFKPISLEKQPYADICKNFSNIFLDEYFKAGDVTYVLPFDPSVQILYYRRDLFENALISREFYEKHRRQLRIPQNYKEYDEVAKFFTRKFNPNSPTKYGTALVYGSAAVAACDFLPRWREKGGKLLNEKGELQINTPEMKNALEAYVKAWSYSDKSMCKWWKQAMKLFADGITAMNIGFSNHASTMVLENHSDIAGKVGFSAIPGGKPLLGGGVIGISRYTEKDELCEKFLRWIYSEKISSTITSLGGYINHKNLIFNQDILQMYPWIEGMEKAFAVGERNLTRNCCCVDEVLLEEIIGEAVRSAVLGVRPIDEILEIMQKKCVELLKK